MSFRTGTRLGIDWGEARIGVAACDPAGTLAYPVRTVMARNEARAITEILELVAEYDPVLELVVGLPRTLKGKEGPAAQQVRRRTRLLRQRLDPGVGIRLVDERLTTAQASRDLSAAGRDSRAQRAVIDQAAAVGIIEYALSIERSTGEPAGEHVPTQKAT